MLFNFKNTFLKTIHEFISIFLIKIHNLSYKNNKYLNYNYKNIKKLGANDYYYILVFLKIQIRLIIFITYKFVKMTSFNKIRQEECVLLFELIECS